MESHHRRSIRLRGYDYTQPGAYFVTIMTYNGDHRFGKVVDGVMELDALGEIVREEWFKTALVRPYVRLYEDEFVVMPNHIHSIVWIVDTSSSGDQQYNDLDAIKPTHDHVEGTHTAHDPARRGTAALCPYCSGWLPPPSPRGRGEVSVGVAACRRLVFIRSVPSPIGGTSMEDVSVSALPVSVESPFSVLQ